MLPARPLPARPRSAQSRCGDWCTVGHHYATSDPFDRQETIDECDKKWSVGVSAGRMNSTSVDNRMMRSVKVHHYQIAPLRSWHPARRDN